VNIFELDVAEGTAPARILIIDDVVNSGTTIEWFIKKAIQNGLINNVENVEIRAICIYNRPKMVKPKLKKE
jgi:hypoxanthine phosphoribosyltransferase